MLSRLPTLLLRPSLRQLSSSPFASIPMGPPDPIMGLNESFKLDERPPKINVGLGAYRTDGGKPYTLPCVGKAQARLAGQELDNE
jgi:aspartate/tyrosine/aromatic aminotransferase